MYFLRCSSVVHTYEWATEVQAEIVMHQIAEPHHLPTLLNTKPARGKTLIIFS